MLPAPLDHAAMKIQPDVFLRRLALLQELTCDATAATPKVKYERIHLRGKFRENRISRRIVEEFLFDRANQSAQFQRWKWYVCSCFEPKPSHLVLRARN